MKISTKGRYAVRLLLDIAMNDEVEPVRLKDVAERQDIFQQSDIRFENRLFLHWYGQGLLRASEAPREDIVYQRHRRNIQ